MIPLLETSEAVRRAGREVMRKGLTWGTAGNISARLSPSTFLISTSGRALDDLDGDGLIVCDLEAATLEGGGRPSVETRMHAQVYRVRSDAGAVLHASPFHATVLACSEIDPDPNLSTDTAYYVRKVRRVPYRTPGSVELATSAAQAAREADTLLLDNHGALTIGSTVEEAVTRMEALELLCHMMTFECLGVPFRPLTERQVDGFVHSLGGYGASGKEDSST